MDVQKNIFISLFLAILLIVAVPALHAQNSAYKSNSHNLDYRMFRVALVPGISSNGFDATHVVSKYSLNLLGGYSGALERGFEFGTLVNINKFYAEGVQVAGLGNYSGEETQGVQLAGLANISRDGLQGFQLAGIANFASEDIQGIQAGLLNITEYGQGIQFGLINYGRDFEGAPIGLISYYREGRSQVDLWTSDAGFTNIGIKLGTDEIYNMISFGYNPGLENNVWQLGWSIGRLHEYRKHFLYTDLSYFKINEDGWTKDLNSMVKYRLLFGRELGPSVKFYGGPTFNMMITRTEKSDRYTWYRLFDFGAKAREYVFWLGYSVGFELL